LTFLGVLLNQPGRHGRADGNGKLTIEQAEEIASSTLSTCVLVQRYSVSSTTVRNIRRAKRLMNSAEANLK
jgi:hypothetical protein